MPSAFITYVVASSLVVRCDSKSSLGPSGHQVGAEPLGGKGEYCVPTKAIVESSGDQAGL